MKIIELEKPFMEGNHILRDTEDNNFKLEIRTKIVSKRAFLKIYPVLTNRYVLSRIKSNVKKLKLDMHKQYVQLINYKKWRGNPAKLEGLERGKRCAGDNWLIKTLSFMVKDCETGVSSDIFSVHWVKDLDSVLPYNISALGDYMESGEYGKHDHKKMYKVLNAFKQLGFNNWNNTPKILLKEYRHGKI